MALMHRLGSDKKVGYNPVMYISKFAPPLPKGVGPSVGRRIRYICTLSLVPGYFGGGALVAQIPNILA